MTDSALRFAVQDLFADYAAHLDGRDYQAWLDLFARECRYVVQPRENHERDLPLATMRLTSRSMLEDRIGGVVGTIYHAPYYQRHVIGPPRFVEDRIEANFLVVRTHYDQPSDLFCAGRYLTRLRHEDEAWRIADQLVVFDSELIPNSMIYPI